MKTDYLQVVRPLVILIFLTQKYSGKKHVLLLSFKILNTKFKQKVCYTSFEFSESQEMWKTLRWKVRKLQAAHKPTASHAGRADSNTGASG